MRWITSHDHCPVCGLVYVRNQGDTWLYWIVMDRIPLALGIIMIYFGFRVSDWKVGVMFFLAMAVPLVVTMPHRQGIAIALNYLSRLYFEDPSDEIPPALSPRGHSAPDRRHLRNRINLLFSTI